MSFSDFNLLPSLLESLTEQHLTNPTEIQTRTVPSLVAGDSVVGVAETGSGKTLAYALPMLHRLKELENEGDPVTKSAHPRGLVLVPSRELGEQVSKVFKSLTHKTRLRVRVALGGAPKRVARKAVSGNFEVLVATPGRLTQLLDTEDVNLTDVRSITFDEADQMVDPGFLPVALRIVRACEHGVQVAMFSATLPKGLEAVVAELFDSPPLRVQTRGSQKLVATLTTQNLEVIDGRRWDLLEPLLAERPQVGTLLFVNTRDQCDRVASWLDEASITHATFRGEMDRIERRNNLRAFRKGEVAVLLATDLGGRGLDIDRVQRVVNVHLPNDIDNYLHRAGRTARAGRKGLVVNLVTARDKDLMDRIRRRERKKG